MACNNATLTVAPACPLHWNSRRQQLIELLVLLAHSINAIDAGFTVNWDTISTAAQDAVGCLNPGQARNKAGLVIHNSLAEPNEAALACFSDGLLEQIYLYLVCALTDVVNP